MSFGARARIRLHAIQHNFQVIKSKATDCRIMAVIKANAYGHGLIPVAHALSGADAFAVARLSEARALRQSGIDKTIVLLGGVSTPEDFHESIENDIQLSVHDFSQIRCLESCGKANARIWLKIDTGMNRLGIHCDDAARAIERLRDCGAVGELSLMTHLANADCVDDEKTALQAEKFLQLVNGFSGDISIANSAAVLERVESIRVFDKAAINSRLWVRPGLSLYGVSPFPKRTGAEFGLQPAMQFESKLISVKKIKTGDQVGYGGTWQASEDTMIGVVSAGYGDGYCRQFRNGTPVLLNDRLVPVVGRVSMDLTTVDLGPDAGDRVGDSVVLWGDELPVETVAEYAGTIPYTLLTGITYREAGIIED